MTDTGCRPNRLLNRCPRAPLNMRHGMLLVLVLGLPLLLLLLPMLL